MLWHGQSPTWHKDSHQNADTHEDKKGEGKCVNSKAIFTYHLRVYWDSIVPIPFAGPVVATKVRPPALYDGYDGPSQSVHTEESSSVPTQPSPETVNEMNGVNCD